MNLSIFENDGTLGQDTSIRLVSFSWNGVASLWSNKSLQQAHAEFNALFTTAFPQLVYNRPFTSYTPLGLGIGSQLTGMAETVMSDSQFRSVVYDLATGVGIRGEVSSLNVSGRTIAELQSGQTLTQPGSTVNPLVTTDGIAKLGFDLFESYKWPVIIGGGLLLGLLLRR